VALVSLSLHKSWRPPFYFNDGHFVITDYKQLIYGCGVFFMAVFCDNGSVGSEVVIMRPNRLTRQHGDPNSEILFPF